RASLAAGLLFSVLPLGAEPSERVLTLEESLTTGLQNSQSLLSLQEQIGLARQRVSEAGSQIYPKIDFNLSASRFNNTIPTVLAPSFNSIYLPAENKDIYYFTRFSLWQYLYAGGRYTTNLRLAEINLSQAQSQADVERNSTLRDVAKSFYACRVLQEKISAFEAALAEAKALAGSDPQQRPRWNAFEDHLSAELVRLRHEYEKQELVFLDTIGIELNTRVALAGDLVPPDEEYDLNNAFPGPSSTGPNSVRPSSRRPSTASG
ncbi:MAG: TolC family protein, partial [Endomicrobiales bacterium]